MKIILKRYIACFILLLLLSLNCKKSSGDKPDETIRLKMDAEGLKYVQLSVGKYFIYKDSANGILDSVVVTKSLLENIFTPAFEGGPFNSAPAYISEIFSLTLTKMDGSNGTVWLEGDTRPALCCPSISSNSQPIQMNGSDDVLVFCYPVSECNSVNLISSLKVEEKVYENVIKVQGGNGGTSEYFWAKSVGLIKRIEKMNSHTNTYTLLRNN